jgi:6,7-dimethyl-8-ribityllumazine synthase
MGVVVAKFNEFITSRLLEGVESGLTSHGVSPEDITVAWVPGSFEIPLIANRMAGSGNYDAVICIGAVIRGETDHYEHVASEAAKGIANASLNTGIPIMFGILTTDTLEQAINRAGAKQGNAGYNTAISAIEMANLVHQISDN